MHTHNSLHSDIEALVKMLPNLLSFIHKVQPWQGRRGEGRGRERRGGENGLLGELTNMPQGYHLPTTLPSLLFHAITSSPPRPFTLSSPPSLTFSVKELLQNFLWVILVVGLSLSVHISGEDRTTLHVKVII